MNLYLRLIYILLKTFFAKRIKVLEESRLRFRVLPTDCDMNLHITNSRYLSFMDLGRTYLMGQLGLLPQLYKRRWGPVIQATELSYFKPVMIGQRFELVTRLLYWDDKYFYMEQRFLVKGQLCTYATVKGLFIGKQQKVPTAVILELLEGVSSQPVKPTFINHWQAMLNAKRDQSQ